MQRKGIVHCWKSTNCYQGMTGEDVTVDTQACVSNSEMCSHVLCVKGSNNVRFEVFTAATMKNGVFWDVTPCGSCKNRRLGGT
jgi:hypothetical protein